MDVIRKGKEVGNFTAVARQYVLDPKMVIRWAKELNRMNVDKVDGTSKRLGQFIPTPNDYKELEQEIEKLKKIVGEQTMERAILKELLKKRIQACG